MGICKNYRAINCTLSLQAGFYRYPFDAQLNQCGKAGACSAATYSVIGMQLARHASNNTSSREGNWAFYPRIYGTGVPEMTGSTADVHEGFVESAKQKCPRAGRIAFCRFHNARRARNSPCK
jgi:hypothetical protein